ncbi:hypothetical protein AGMMS50293_11610 [Spirochaetia bacterium]|nr:hypothetical protein AGMMS50293_11610 [Spirochaetia bacterium]
MTNNINRTNGKKIVCALLLTIAAFPLFAEHEFGFAAAPLYDAPLGVKHIQGGVGAEASLDWAFLQFPASGERARQFGAGLAAGGSFSSLAASAGGPFTLFSGGAGPFVRWRPFDRWTFRFDTRFGAYGYQWEEDSGSRMMTNFALGADFHLSPYISIYGQGGYTLRPFADGQPLNSLGIALGVRLNLSEIMTSRARVQGTKTEQHRVFPVSFAWYEENPIAVVRITNDEPTAITDISLSFFVDNYMGQPGDFAVLPSLASGESSTVPVTALFNEAMLGLTENVSANGEVRIQYRSLGAKKETVFPLQMPVYHRNAMSWDDDRRAASFVSPRDSAARLFALRVAAIADKSAADKSAADKSAADKSEASPPQNVRYAAALFEALRLYGINYIIDPASSFVEMSDNASALDTLNYPYQTLNYRGGDCDDLSILFCSLLEVLGIQTAFITIPGHIYMAFDSGDDEWAAGNRDIIELEGRRWIPVEITMPAEGFTTAWRVGAREWRTAYAENAAKTSGDEEPAARLYPTHESWKLYPPVSVAESSGRLPVLPAEEQINAALARQQKNLTAAAQAR